MYVTTQKNAPAINDGKLTALHFMRFRFLRVTLGPDSQRARAAAKRSKEDYNWNMSSRVPLRALRHKHTMHNPVTSLSPLLELVSSSLASYLSSCNGFDLITELARF